MPLESAFDSAPQPEHFDPAALRHDLFDSTPALLNVLRTFHPWLADMRARLRDAIAAAPHFTFPIITPVPDDIGRHYNFECRYWDSGRGD